MRWTLASKELQAQAENKRAADVVVVADSAISSTSKSVDDKAEIQASPNTEAEEKSIDFRYLPHGDGPCSCCGPWSE